MILQALYDYYQRKLALNQIDPIGFITKEIDFFIIIDLEGNYVRFEDLRIQDGKIIKGTSFRVPSIGKQAQKHDNSGNDPNLLWDKAEFLLGIGKNGEKKLESFIKAIKEFYPEPPEDIQAIIKFYKKELAKSHPFEEIINNKEIFEIIQKGYPILTFKIDGKNLPVTSELHVHKALNKKRITKDLIGTCLITGETNTPIEITHMVIKGIKGTQTSGANLVSFNKSAFLSYNKKQSENAPVGRTAAEAYTKALQNLIDSKHNKVIIADSTIVFWSEKKTLEINPEEIFPWVITMQQTTKDDPDEGVNRIKKLFEAIKTGQMSSERTNHFYVLGLAPNEARISVRFWKAPSVEDFGKNIKQHFDDFEIVHGKNEPKYLSLYQILASTALQYNIDNVPPNLAGAVIESILDGTPYPQSLMQQCIRRIRAERTVNRARAAILKACLNRKIRIQKLKQKEVTMALDPNNNNVAYRIGRLFATLEKIQEEANPGINTTIRDRFYGAASSSPVTVFPRLLSLKNYHLKKIKNEGRKIFFEKLIGEILAEISSFPTNLSLNDQANFAIGYYHQRQEFYTKKSEAELNQDYQNNN